MGYVLSYMQHKTSKLFHVFGNDLCSNVIDNIKITEGDEMRIKNIKNNCSTKHLWSTKQDPILPPVYVFLLLFAIELSSRL